MKMRRGLLMTAVLATASVYGARSFDVISGNTGGVEVVMAPIHHGSLMLQFKGQALYIDPDTKGDYTGMPHADFVFFTAGEKDDPAKYALLKKPSTVVVSAPLADRRVFGEIAVMQAGAGFIFTMAGRRIYVSGESAPVTEAKGVDVAFICTGNTCAKTNKDATAALLSTGAKMVFPYRFEGRNPSALPIAQQPEIRLRRWY